MESEEGPGQAWPKFGLVSGSCYCSCEKEVALEIDQGIKASLLSRKSFYVWSKEISEAAGGELTSDPGHHGADDVNDHYLQYPWILLARTN